MDPKLHLETFIPHGHHLVARYEPDRKWRKLNSKFLPISRKEKDMPTVFDLLPQLTRPALRLWAELMKQLDNREMVIYLPVDDRHHAPLREMEKLNMLRRLKRKHWPRKPGHTTVMISPDLVATGNKEVIEKWLSLQQKEGAASPPKEEDSTC